MATLKLKVQSPEPTKTRDITTSPPVSPQSPDFNDYSAQYGLVRGNAMGLSSPRTRNTKKELGGRSPPPTEEIEHAYEGIEGQHASVSIPKWQLSTKQQSHVRRWQGNAPRGGRHVYNVDISVQGKQTPMSPPTSAARSRQIARPKLMLTGGAGAQAFGATVAPGLPERGLVGARFSHAQYHAPVIVGQPTALLPVRDLMAACGAQRTPQNAARGGGDGEDLPFYKKLGHQLANINASRQTAASTDGRSEFQNATDGSPCKNNINALHASLTAGKDRYIVNNAFHRRNWPLNLKQKLATPKNTDLNHLNISFDQTRLMERGSVNVDARDSLNGGSSIQQHMWQARTVSQGEQGEHIDRPPQFDNLLSPTSLPQVSVKSPNERKPGMRMSTYGGMKRRRQVDRYFFKERQPNLRFSLNDNSNAQNPLDAAGDSLLSQMDGQIDGGASVTYIAKSHNRLVQVANSNKAKLRRQLDSIRIDQLTTDSLGQSSYQCIQSQRQNRQKMWPFQSAGQQPSADPMTTKLSSDNQRVLDSHRSRETSNRGGIDGPLDMQSFENSIEKTSVGKELEPQRIVKARHRADPKTAKRKKRLLPQVSPATKQIQDQNNSVVQQNIKKGLEALNKSCQVPKKATKPAAQVRPKVQVKLSETLNPTDESSNDLELQPLTALADRRLATQQGVPFPQGGLNNSQELPRGSRPVERSTVGKERASIGLNDSIDLHEEFKRTISKWTDEFNQDRDKHLRSMDTDPKSIIIRPGPCWSQGPEVECGGGGLDIFGSMNEELPMDEVRDDGSDEEDEHESQFITDMHRASSREKKEKTRDNVKVEDPLTIPRPKAGRKIRKLPFKLQSAAEGPHARVANQGGIEMIDEEQDQATSVQMKVQMEKAKRDIQAALEKSCLVLRAQRDYPANKQHFPLKPSLPVTVPLKPYIREYVVVEIYGKLQPANIRFQGFKEIFNVYLSTSDKFPDKETCHAQHHNQKAIQFYLGPGAAEQKNMKFNKSFLFVCLESASEVFIKANVTFGPEDKQKQLPDTTLADQRFVDSVREHFDFDKRLRTDGGQDVKELLFTAAKNASEHQERVKLQIDKMIDDRKLAADFMRTLKAQQRARLEKERSGNETWRDIVAGNIQDAGVWKDLDAFTRSQMHHIQRQKETEAHERKEAIDTQARIDAENALQRREHNKKIREHINATMDRYKQSQFRMKQLVAHRTIRFYLQTLAANFECRLEAKRRLNKRMFAALAAKFKIRRIVRRKGADFGERVRRQGRNKLSVAAAALHGAQCRRAANVLRQMLKDLRGPSQLREQVLYAAGVCEKFQVQMRRNVFLKGAQMTILQKIVSRERQALVRTLTDKGSTPAQKKVAMLIGAVPEARINQVLGEYHNKCIARFAQRYSDWRSEVKELVGQGKCDDENGWSQPGLAAKIIWSFEDIAYDPDLKPTTIQHMASLTEDLLKAYRYNIQPSVLEEEDRDQKLEDQRNALKRKAYDEAFLEKVKGYPMDRRTASLVADNDVKDRGYGEAQEEDSQEAKKEEDSQGDDSQDENSSQDSDGSRGDDDAPRAKKPPKFVPLEPCRFPLKPYLKYLPAAGVSHLLLVTAANKHKPDFEQNLNDAFKKKK